MTRAIRAFNKGRARIWWVHHGREATRAAQLTTLVALFIAASAFDYEDQLAMERSAREDAERQLADERALRGIPNPAIVIDARNAERFGIRLAEIAGGLDAERQKLRGVR